MLLDIRHTLNEREIECSSTCRSRLALFVTKSSSYSKPRMSLRLSKELHDTHTYQLSAVHYLHPARTHRKVRKYAEGGELQDLKQQRDQHLRSPPQAFRSSRSRNCSAVSFSSRLLLRRTSASSCASRSACAWTCMGHLSGLLPRQPKSDPCRSNSKGQSHDSNQAHSMEEHMGKNMQE